MLSLAVEARLSLVAVSSRDTINLFEVLKEITGKKPHAWAPQQALKPVAGQLYVIMHYPKMELLPWHTIYGDMVQAESTLIVVNPPKIADSMFDAGEVPTPRSLLRGYMNHVTGDDGKTDGLLRGLGGCTIKESIEFAKLTMARDNSLTPDGLMVTRKSSFQAAKGLTQVDVEQDFYEPHDALVDWLELNKGFFLHGEDPRLVPRGLLFDGAPGTGKSAGSKWLAHNLGVPLYRVDIGGTKNKYVGASESNMLTNLSRLDHEEPAVALLDEVEKVFSTSHSDTSGTTSTMLSQLLWWLAERKARVLVVMTTNNAKALPRELYREGRVDRTMTFEGLEWAAAGNFVKHLLSTFDFGPTKGPAWSEIVQRTFMTSVIPGSEPKAVSHAALTTATFEAVKRASTTPSHPLALPAE